MFIKSLFVLLFSSLAFDFLLKRLDKKNSKILSPLSKISEKWKGRWTVKWIARLILIIILAIVEFAFGVNDILVTIILGFSLSLSDLAFDKSKIDMKIK